jgi:aryl-alcohol dehydrogenase-like predicted oxidoreductase
MRYRTVSSMESVTLSEIGLGCWPFSGASVWDGFDKKASISTIHRALDLGVNFFDVAPVYGFGEAERVTGAALKGRDRSSFTIASKCGLVWDDAKQIKNDLSPESIRKEVEMSLRRLQTDVIDLYQMHWPDPSTPIEDTMDILLRLKEEGKIRFIGASNFSVRISEAAMKQGGLASQQGLYNMLERNPSSYHGIELTYRTEEEVLPFCKKHGQAFFPYSPLFQGLLSGDFEGDRHFGERDVRSQNPKLQGGELASYLSLVFSLKQYCAELIGKPLNEVAINWLLYRREVTSVICGAQNERQIEANAKASEWELTEDQYQELNRIAQGTA